MCGRKGTLLLLLGMYINATTVEISMEGLLKTKIELPYDPAIPLLGIYPNKSIILKDTCTRVDSSTIYNSHDMGTT